jgi:nicotinate-nucleotide adenylyltransferase
LKLGIFGGTFNPVHNGHLFLALEARQKAGLDRVVFVPNRRPPHKKEPDVCPETRYDMLCQAVENVPEFEVSRVELDREGRSFTIDTLESFPAEQSLTFLCGTDAFNADWFRLEDVVERLDALVLANRSGYPFEMPTQLQALPKSLKDKVQLMTFPDIAISSSAIRQRVRTSQPFRFLIPEPVYRMIVESTLYENNSPTRKRPGRKESIG